jgi:hypothetical protein
MPGKAGMVSSRDLMMRSRSVRRNAWIMDLQPPYFLGVELSSAVWGGGGTPALSLRWNPGKTRMSLDLLVGLYWLLHVFCQLAVNTDQPDHVQPGVWVRELCAESHMTWICRRACYLLANKHHMSTSNHNHVTFSHLPLDTLFSHLINERWCHRKSDLPVSLLPECKGQASCP